MNMKKKAILIVLDSVGAGALPDAAAFGDEGANTLGHIAERMPLNIPHMQAMGLGGLPGLGIPFVENGRGAYGRAAEKSMGKDTTTGHWEMSGVILPKPFPTYPHGFPADVIAAFENAIGTKTLGNKPASGTAILDELGEEHMKTGYPIVYTSADSVFQIAAHEEIVPLAELYEICGKARKILDPYYVSRVIARPFVGSCAEDFTRTPNRRDFAMKPFEETILDRLKAAGYEVAGVGKIEDIFAGVGLTRAVHTASNMDGVDKTLEYMKEVDEGLIFTNLVDFDMLYGHRNNVAGYGEALKEFDCRLPEIISALREDDLLLITADHGCDPCTASTDHSREFVPLLAYGKGMTPRDLGIRETFADLAATIADYFGLSPMKNGKSFYPEILS